MPTIPVDTFGRRVALGCVAVAVVAAGMVSASGQETFALSRLTVPANNLPEGCQVAPYVPATSSVAPVGNAMVVTSNPGSSYPFSANPWVGTDHRLLLYLFGPPPVPDGPPPSISALRQWEAQWVRHVREGYRALYDVGDGRRIEVVALGFEAGGLPSTGWPAGAEFRIGNVVAAVRAPTGPKTQCAQAIEMHIQALR